MTSYIISMVNNARKRIDKMNLQGIKAAYLKYSCDFSNYERLKSRHLSHSRAVKAREFDLKINTR